MEHVYHWFILIAGCYFIVWTVPLTIQSIVVSLENSKRIEFIDEQLAKDITKLRKQPLNMTFISIGGRFNRYCIAYPFIFRRAMKKSNGFHILMILNSLWFYCFSSVLLVGIINKILGGL